MPTYEYRCPNGHDFEKFFRSISSAEAESAIVCPVCGAIALRQMSSAGLMFKGSGFYLTDYGKNAHGRKGPPATAGSGEGSASGGGESSGGADSSKGDESGGSGDSSGRSGEAKGASPESGGGAEKSTGSRDSAKSGEAKKTAKKGDTASTPTKPSSGKPKE